MKLFQAGRQGMEKKNLRQGAMPAWAIIVASAGAVVALGTATAQALPASAAVTNRHAARFAAAATAFQNKVIDQVMARARGGIRVSAGEVRWPDGIFVGVPTSPTAHVILGDSTNPGLGDSTKSSVAPDLTSNCIGDTFCAFSKPNFGGCGVGIGQHDTNLFFDWALFSEVSLQCSENGTVGAGTWSWVNKTSFKVWKAQGHSGGQPGTNLAPWSVSGGSNTGTTWCIPAEVQNANVTDTITRTLGWIQMTGSTGPCLNNP